MSMSSLELSIAKNAPGLLRVPGLSAGVASHYRRALATPWHRVVEWRLLGADGGVELGTRA